MAPRAAPEAWLEPRQDAERRFAAYQPHREPAVSDRRANLDKGSDYTEAIRNDLAEYEKCFYSATQLRESDVLSRKYLPLSKVLKNVKAWAARRGGAGAWQPIGVPAVSHSSREVNKLMRL